MENGGIIELAQGYIDWSLYSDTCIDDDGGEAQGEEYVKIDNLFVKPSFRGQGYARKLLESALKLIKKQYPTHTIKIVPEPKDRDVDCERLTAFYSSFADLDVIAF